MSGDLPILRICFRFHMPMLSLLMLSINAYSFSKASLGLDQVNALTSERSKVPSSFFSSPVYSSNEEVTTRDLSSLLMFNYISAFACSITSFGIPAPASQRRRTGILPLQDLSHLILSAICLLSLFAQFAASLISIMKELPVERSS